jgi:hypothetical protein
VEFVCESAHQGRRHERHVPRDAHDRARVGADRRENAAEGAGARVHVGEHVESGMPGRGVGIVGHEEEATERRQTRLLAVEDADAADLLSPLGRPPARAAAGEDRLRTGPVPSAALLFEDDVESNQHAPQVVVFCLNFG